MIKLFLLLSLFIFVNSHVNLQPLNKDCPHVPDPKFPKLPLEYLNSVDQTCQFLFYVGTLTWEVIPDHSMIKVNKLFYKGRYKMTMLKMVNRKI